MYVIFSNPQGFENIESESECARIVSERLPYANAVTYENGTGLCKPVNGFTTSTMGQMCTYKDSKTWEDGISLSVENLQNTYQLEDATSYFDCKQRVCKKIVKQSTLKYFPAVAENAGVLRACLMCTNQDMQILLIIQIWYQMI